MLTKVTPALLQPPSLLSSADIPLACDLFEQVFKHPAQPHQWLWKYHQGPRLGAINVGIKSPSGQLLAHAGASVFEGQYFDDQGLIQHIPMAQVCDVMVHESARDAVTHQGAYGQVIHALQKQLAQAFPGVYAYGFAGVRPYKLGLKMDLYKWHQDCRMGKLEVPVQEPQQTAGKSKGPLLNSFFHSIFNSEKLTPLTFNKQDPAEFLKYQAQFDEWAHAWGVSDAPKVLRTAAYLQWRFVQNPNAQYQFWLYRKGGKNLAWLVTRELIPGQLTVVDALMHPKMQQNILSIFHQQTHVHSVSSWHIQTEESLKLEPIKACEVKVGEWHACKSPVFWPADTDVF